MSEVTTVQAITASERANEVLVGLLERAISGVDAAVEFSQAEIPVVVEQLLTWHFVESLVQTVVGLLLIGLGIGFALWCLRREPEAAGEIKNHWGETVTRYKKSIWFDKDGDMTGIQAFSLFSIMPIAAGVLALDVDWLKIWIAPKLYLLEYGASLVK